MNLKSILSALLPAAALTLGLSSPAQALVVSSTQGTWQTTLQARDLNKDGVTDAFYDTTLKITWLRDANVNGRMNWSTANAWATGYSFGGFDDWRLPTMVDTGTPGCNASFTGGTDCGFNVQTTSGSTVYSEMASLYYDTLGNNSPYSTSGANQLVFGLKNIGDFQNMLSNFYWFSLESATGSEFAWYFGNNSGAQATISKERNFYALAVRSGDVTVATVPEPGSLVLALTMLAGLGWTLRRRAAGSSAL